MLEPFEYLRKFYPHFRHDEAVAKFIVPIRSKYHRVLFPDYAAAGGDQLALFKSENPAGNAIKLAYLCHAQTKTMTSGDNYSTDLEMSVRLLALALSRATRLSLTPTSSPAG
jgi:hypothetical protein